MIIWAGYMSVMEEVRNLHKLVGEPQEGHLNDTDIDGEIIVLQCKLKEQVVCDLYRNGSG
jgi:hypothetical protein